jgi:hypothetical protein
MISESTAREIAQSFIHMQWGRELKAECIVFMSAEKRKERVVELIARPGDAELAAQLIATLRDYWAVNFPTILNEGTQLVEATTVAVDAQTGTAYFAP